MSKIAPPHGKPRRLRVQKRADVVKKAFILNSRAAGHGNANAQANLGGMYAMGIGVDKDYNKAIEWLTKAAEQNHANAQYELGRMYTRGNGVPVDYQIAASWLIKAMNQGHEGAKQGLNIMLIDGLIQF